MILNWVAVTWGVLALILICAEIIAPGAFLLWLGFAAAVLFITTLLVPSMGILLQIILFAIFSFIFIQLYRKYFRRTTRESDQPLLNRRAEQLIGNVYRLETPIYEGRGQVRVGDAIWSVVGDDLEAGRSVRVVAVHGMDLRVEPLPN